MRFATSGLFHRTFPSEPLIHGLKPFRIWVRIREDIRQSRLDTDVYSDFNRIREAMAA
jgi:hypothetical protein